MRNKVLISFLLLICCNLLLFSCTEKKHKYTDKEVPTTPMANESKGAINTLYAPIPVIGTIDELEKDTNCEQEIILAYAETDRFHIYLCGNESILTTLVILPIDRNSNKIVIKEIPLRIGYSYRFKQGEVWYTLRRPSPIFQSASFSIYDHLNKKALADQHVSRYLFNKQINPDYQKSFTPRDKQVEKQFLEFLPDFHEQADVCRSTLYGEPVRKPKSVSAYKIDSERYLVQMLCLGGSYNLVWQYVLYSKNSSDQQGEIIKFETLRPPTFEKIESEIIIGNPEFFPEDNRLTNYSKGRGSGGCGSFAEYKLVDNRFELQEFRDKNCTNDGNWQFPEEYPKIYP